MIVPFPLYQIFLDHHHHSSWKMPTARHRPTPSSPCVVTLSSPLRLASSWTPQQIQQILIFNNYMPRYSKKGYYSIAKSLLPLSCCRVPQVSSHGLYTAFHLLPADKQQYAVSFNLSITTKMCLPVTKSCNKTIFISELEENPCK